MWWQHRSRNHKTGCEWNLLCRSFIFPPLHVITSWYLVCGIYLIGNFIGLINEPTLSFQAQAVGNDLSWFFYFIYCQTTLSKHFKYVQKEDLFKLFIMRMCSYSDGPPKFQWISIKLEKSLMLGKIEGRRRRHHWLNGCEFKQSPGDGEEQGNLGCCSPWCRKESDTNEWTTTKHKMTLKFPICSVT